MVTTGISCGGVLHRRTLGTSTSQAEFHHVRGQHEDDQQHQHHVHERRDVDLRQAFRRRRAAATRIRRR